MRNTLDEYEGVTRLFEGKNKLVFTRDGKLTTGYDGAKSTVNAGYAFLGQGSRASSTHVWDYRDALQQKLVRQARRLPYEVPAFYAADKYLAKPLFGTGEEKNQGPKRKWYNPARGIDLGKDLLKTSLFQMGGFMLPTAALGAAKDSSLNFFRTAEQRLLSTSVTSYSTLTKAPFFGGGAKHAIYERSLNLKGALEVVGHDLIDVLHKSVKFSERSSGALSSAFLAMNDINKNPVAGLYSQRRGNIPQGSGTQVRRRDTIQHLARDIYDVGAKVKGSKKKLNNGLVGTTKIDSLLDLIPGYKAINTAAKTGQREYRHLGLAQDFLESKDFNVIQKKLEIFNPTATGVSRDDTLGTAIANIQRKRTSSLFESLHEGVDELGLDVFGSPKFTRLVRQTQYKERLHNKLVEGGMDKQHAKRFTDTLGVSDDPFRPATKDRPKDYISASERFSMGPDTEPYGGNFYDELIARFNTGKVGKNANLPSNFGGEQLKTAIDATDALYIGMEVPTLYPEIGDSLEVPGRLYSGVFNSFSKHIKNSVLGEQKLNINNYTEKLTSGGRNNAITKRIEMARRAGKVLGLSDDIINDIKPGRLAKELGNRGININNDAQLRGYLLNNKEMSYGSSSGIAGIFGLRKLTLDEFQKSEEKTAGIFKNTFVDKDNLTRKNALKKILSGDTEERKMLGRIIQKTELPNTVKGYYADSQGKMVNLNPIRAAKQKIGEFLGNELKIPIIGINPMQMLGFKDFSQMSKAGKFQVSTGASNHPFINSNIPEGFNSQILSWHSTGGFLGTKGKLYSYDSAAVKDSHNYRVESLSGFYRPLPTNSTSMFASTAELAAGATTKSAASDTGFLGRVKEKLNYDSEQPNSLFRFAGRIINRQADINNDAVMAKLLSSNLDEEFTIGGFGRKRSLKLSQERGKETSFALRDAKSGEQVASHAALMEAFTNFANKQLNYGTNKTVIRKFLGDNSELLNNATVGKNHGGVAPLSIDDIVNIHSPANRDKVVSMLGNNLDRIKKNNLIGDKKSHEMTGEQYVNIRKAFSRLKKSENIEDFSAQSPMYAKSSSIVTRGDEFSSEVFRYLLEYKGLTQNSNTFEIMKQVAGAIDELASKGMISSAQKAEAQAATLSTLLNLSAFKTYRFDQTGKGDPLEVADVLLNPLKRFESAREAIKEIPSAIDPYLSGTISKTTAGIFSYEGLSLAKPTLRKNFGIGKYVMKPKATSFSGQSEDQAFTYIPTFGTALKNNPTKTLLSAAGIKTYGSPEGFSLASVPMSHGFNRLNRYFGTTGSGLDAERFNGPLDLYIRGMNAQRVLPAVAIGSTVLAVDRTAGGLTGERDQRGENVYSPLVLGKVARVGAEVQAGISGIVPGGMSYGQKRQQIIHGEVGIRKGRFWSLGNTKLKGGEIEYFRPSWYRRFQAGAMFTSDTYGSPIEKALFYNDYSPLRPLDPYRFERKHYEDRPYPTTGEYFSGPYGAAVPILNATVGRILKPQRIMHKPELDRALSSYVPVGVSGAYMPQEEVGAYPPYGQMDSSISYSAAVPTDYNRKALRFISPSMGQRWNRYFGWL